MRLKGIIIFIIILAIMSTETKTIAAYIETNDYIYKLGIDIGALEENPTEKAKEIYIEEIYQRITMLPGGNDNIYSENMFFELGELNGYPEDLTDKDIFTREDLIRVAKSVLDVSKDMEGNQPVPYYWGGRRPLVKGHNAQWLKPRICTYNEGNEDNFILGREYPYGLDCSGFVAWVYAQLPEGQKNSRINTILEVDAMGQYNNALIKNLSVSQLLPGDIGIYGDGSHIGIFLGVDPDNNIPMFIHSGGSSNAPNTNDSQINNTYERGRVLISYLKSYGNEYYTTNINGIAVDNKPANFTKFARILEFPGD